MPTYDYKCDACEHEFEQFQSIKAEPMRKCPSCGKPKLRRLIGTGAGLLFKGKGFYITDYRSESYQSSAKKESGASGTAAGDGKSSATTPAGDGSTSTASSGKKAGSAPKSGNK